MLKNIINYYNTRDPKYLPSVPKKETVELDTCIAHSCYLCDPKHLRPRDMCPHANEEWMY